MSACSTSRGTGSGSRAQVLARAGEGLRWFFGTGADLNPLLCF